jgi:hypothetical protein
VPCASKNEREILPRQRAAVLEVRAVEGMIQPPSGSKAGSPPVKATLIHAQEVAQDQIAVLEKSSGRQIVTLADAVRETAVLGGYQYYHTASPPGVKALWLGWRELTAVVRG